jgi:hypothetical protein
MKTNNSVLIFLILIIIIAGCSKGDNSSGGGTSNPAGYICNNGKCVGVSDISQSQYSTLSECQMACGSGSGYNCISGNCVPVSSNAQYSTLSECQMACVSGSGYNCISGNCVPVSSNAQYSNLTKCQSACASNLGVPSLAIPSYGATGLWTPINFSWSPVSGATKYDFKALYYVNGNLNGGFALANDITNNSYNYNGNLATTGWNGKVIYWQVRAKNSTVTGNWSPMWSFTLKN